MTYIFEITSRRLSRAVIRLRLQILPSPSSWIYTPRPNSKCDKCLTRIKMKDYWLAFLPTFREKTVSSYCRLILPLVILLPLMFQMLVLLPLLQPIMMLCRCWCRLYYCRRWCRRWCRWCYRCCYSASVLLTICLHISDRKSYFGFGCTFDRQRF